jgi:hypothetical protein
MNWDNDLIENLAEMAGIHPNYLKVKVRNMLRGLAETEDDAEA